MTVQLTNSNDSLLSVCTEIFCEISEKFQTKLLEFSPVTKVAMNDLKLEIDIYFEKLFYFFSLVTADNFR